MEFQNHFFQRLKLKKQIIYQHNIFFGNESVIHYFY